MSSLSLDDFIDQSRAVEGMKKEAFYKKYQGHIMSWEAPLSQFFEVEGYLVVQLDTKLFMGVCTLSLPAVYRDIVSEFKRGEIIRFRGVFMGINSLMGLDSPHLNFNYVELL